MMIPIVLMCVALAAATPASDTKLVVTEEFYPELLAKYSGHYDILDIMVPLNELNEDLKDNDSNVLGDEHISYVFFVEGELMDGAIQDYKGVYVYKNGKAKMILGNGQSFTYGSGKIVYIGASDGVYTYNYEDDTVVKYGSFSGSIIKMAYDTFHQTIYFLTSDYSFYKFAHGETTPTKFEAVKDVKDFVFDFVGNMFYYDSTMQFYVYKDKSYKIEGLPTSHSKVVLIKASLLLKNLYIVIDGTLYEINKDAQSKKTAIQFQAMPTAFGPDATLVEYYAYNKKMYEYNLGALIKATWIPELKTFFTENDALIKAIVKTKPHF